MPIQFACSCGRVVRAPDAAAGRRSKCPGCGAPITVPEPSPEPAPADEATRVCPQCCETIPASAPTCRHCGEWLEAEPAIERDLPAEAHLKAVALSCQAVAALVLIAATFGIVHGLARMAAPASHTRGVNADSLIGLLEVLVSTVGLGLGMGLLLSGFRLTRFSRGARAAAVCLIATTAFANVSWLFLLMRTRDPLVPGIAPALNVIAGLAIMAALCTGKMDRIFTPEYARVARLDRRPVRLDPTNPFAWGSFVLLSVEPILWLLQLASLL